MDCRRSKPQNKWAQPTNKYWAPWLVGPRGLVGRGPLGPAGPIPDKKIEIKKTRISIKV